MKKLLTLLILSSCFIMSAQDDLEIKGTIVNKQNIPVEYAAISIPSAFLRTVTSQEGKFNISLVNMDYGNDDVILISSENTDEIIEITIGDYLKLDRKVIVINSGSQQVAKPITDNEKEPVKNTEAKKTSLVLENVKKGNKISIKNNRGKAFFNEIIATENLTKKDFDLNYLKDGKYFFEIEKDSQVDYIPFTISYEEGVIYLKNSESTLFKPHINVRNEVVIFSLISPNKIPVTIKIYNDSNELVFNETTKGELSIQRAFKLKKGSFKVTIKSRNKEYSTKINI